MHTVMITHKGAEIDPASYWAITLGGINDTI